MIRRRLLAALAVAAALGFTVPAAASIPAVTPVAAVQLPATADRCCSGDANGDAEALPCGYPLEGGDRRARSSAALGDIDGDGTPDVAVGTSRDGDGANPPDRPGIVFRASRRGAQLCGGRSREVPGAADVRVRVNVFVVSVVNIARGR